MKRFGVFVMLVVGCGGPSASPEPAPERASGGEATTPEASSETSVAPAVALAAEPEPARAPIVPAHGPLGEDDLRRGVLARLADPLFPSCTVSALPPSLRRRATAVDNAELRRAVAMPIPETTVSAGRAEDHEIAVYLSPRLDPASEIADLGYRAQLRDASGHAEDLSLGISALRPLVLLHNPMLPLVEDGQLQLEAQLRAIDDASIDFQPAEGITTARDGRERLVRCSLTDLRRDQDADGLTDLEEQRLITDAWDPDTDGDGARDSEDRSPLGNAGASAPADAVWVAAYRDLVRPAAGDGLLLAVRSGTRVDVAGEAAGRVLILREDELGAYQRRFGLRAPFTIAVTMHGEDRASVIVDDVRRETTYDGRRDASGRWSFEAHRPRARR